MSDSILDSSLKKADPGISKNDLKDLESVRDYFLDHDKTPFEHNAYRIMSKHIKYLKTQGGDYE